MSRFLVNKHQALTPYTPGEQPRDMQYVKLNTNESPFPPAPGVLEVITRGEIEALRLYPDPSADTLITALAKHYSLQKEQVFVSGGSDEALAYAFAAFCDEKTGLLCPDITYGFYSATAAFLGLDLRRAPLLEDYSVRIADYAACGRTIVLPNPNAPTGIFLPLEQVRQLCRTNPDTVVIIDEAYVDFGAESAVSLLPECENLLVVQTFSKSRSLAGGRIGMAFGSAELIADLNRMKFAMNPYDITRLSLLCGVKAVEDAAYFDRCRRQIMENRDYTAEQLRTLGFRVLPSLANFVFAAPQRISGGEYYQKLKQRGVLVRYFPGARTEAFVRITIGTREQMDALLSATKSIFAEV